MSSISKKSRPKKYRCDLEGCGKAYSRPCLLEQHIRTHSNQRPFECDQCGKSFFRDSHLKVHLWTHSSDKPLKCQICSKGFVTSQQLGRHLKTHPSDFKCPYECEDSFLTNEDLSEHMLSTHVMNDIIDLGTHQNKTAEIINTLQSQLDFPGIKSIPTFQVYSPSSTNNDNSPAENGTSSMGGSKSDGGSISSDSTNDINISSGKGFWDNWDDHHCKEPNCKGYPKYNSFQDLIYHYDEYHEFIPESLFEAFETNLDQEPSVNSVTEWNL